MRIVFANLRTILLSLSFVFIVNAQRPPLVLSGDIEGVHDPAIISVGTKYLLFVTGEAHPGHIPIRCSSNLAQWSLCGRVFPQLPAWTTTEIPGSTTVWAPDISKYNQEYRIYYAISTFGHNGSAIGLVTNSHLDPENPGDGWIDKGMVLRSNDSKDNWNAIDPNLIVDVRRQQWLVFGSFWSGIKMRRIDAQTGMLDQHDTTLYSVAERPRTPDQPDAIEAPFIVRHSRFYYLFVSFDFCCRGAKSTYNVVVGRSTKVTGPYQDSDGKSMLSGGGTRLVAGTDRWRGPGHEAVLQTRKGDYLIYHAYNAETGKPSLQISPITWRDGWPIVAPPN